MAKKTAPSTDTTPELSYEQARAELIDVVAKLESGQAPLAESMQLWERGEALATTCQTWLDGAQARIAKTAEIDAE